MYFNTVKSQQLKRKRQNTYSKVTYTGAIFERSRKMYSMSGSSLPNFLLKTATVARRTISFPLRIWGWSFFNTT